MQENDAQPDVKYSTVELGFLGVFFRGTLMGMAELVPGVSGGTMAFISGIYFRLIAGLASFGFGSIRLLTDPREFWQHHQLSFLLALGLGMGMGIAGFARVIGYLMEHAQPVLWAFFTGVIIVSVYQIGSARHKKNLLVFGTLGLMLGLGFLLLPAQNLSGSLVALYFAGMVAVCAWILPGISGSFVLLLLGLYADVIVAVNALDLTFLLVLGAGCASGLLLFTRALSWLLANFEDPLLALLTGFMATALIKLWPWQQSGLSAQGAWQNLFAPLLWPSQYAAEVGADFVWVALGAAAMGGMGVWLLSKFSPR
jgi:putative membrane protein